PGEEHGLVLRREARRGGFDRGDAAPQPVGGAHGGGMVGGVPGPRESALPGVDAVPGRDEIPLRDRKLGAVRGEAPVDRLPPEEASPRERELRREVGAEGTIRSLETARREGGRHREAGAPVEREASLRVLAARPGERPLEERVDAPWKGRIVPLRARGGERG